MHQVFWCTNVLFDFLPGAPRHELPLLAGNKLVTTRWSVISAGSYRGILADIINTQSTSWIEVISPRGIHFIILLLL
ncbi:hypothetical protein EV199_0807 [Pseudobacter ginsenosidimutans]|uniref:Uncharacterized protein n=1 Tax=Pseudobacter ginsenosidimutans TaxID=661488 RepID=A0A4Q7N380_9BACT|nr:hypothetical protein EV199_0807 [Pseudobacter ginsenosidimutans]